MVRRALAVAACGCIAILGCGTKGPPLAPFVRVPAAVDEISVRRVGSDVYVTLTVPNLNIDDSAPVDVARVAVYGYTGRTAPAQARWAELSTLVTTVQVEPPAEEGASPNSASASGVIPGALVTIRDALSPEEFVQGPVDGPASGAPALAETNGASVSQPLRRFYLAIAFNVRGRPGPPGAVVDLPLEPLPDPPTGVVARFTEREILVAWGAPAVSAGSPPGERAGAVQPGPGAGANTVAPLLAQAPTTYNVYLDDGRSLPASVVEPGQTSEPPMPLNPEALSSAMFSEPVVFGRERCYHVRTVRMEGSTEVESEASMSACVTPTDIFPPARPGLPATVAADGAITLIWEANGEPDIAGYLVLRGLPGDDTLRPLTPTPIVGTSFRDASVTAGTRYVYAVVAIDNNTPVGNASTPSERVEETAR